MEEISRSGPLFKKSLDILARMCYYNSAKKKGGGEEMTTKEIGKEAKETYNAIMQGRGLFSTDKQWNYYLTEIVRQLILEVNTNL